MPYEKIDLIFLGNRGEGIATVRPYLVANRETLTDRHTPPSKSQYKRICDSETYKETTKGKFHHITRTVQYPVLIRVLVLFSNVYGTVLMSTVWVLVSVQ